MLQNFTVSDYRGSLMAFINSLETNRGPWGLGSQEITMNSANIRPFTIRKHVALAAGKNAYEFDLKGTVLAVERALTDSDIFQAFSMALGIQRYNLTTPDFKNPLYHAPDPLYHGTAAAPLELVYNGSLDFTTDSTNRIENFDCSLLRYSPAATYNEVAAAANDNPSYGPSFEERGFYIFPSYPIIHGNKNNKVKLSLAPGVTTNIANTGDNANSLVLLIHGFLYSGQNGGSCNA